MQLVDVAECKSQNLEFRTNKQTQGIISTPNRLLDFDCESPHLHADPCGLDI